jgi:hypothetical protein
VLRQLVCSDTAYVDATIGAVSQEDPAGARSTPDGEISQYIIASLDGIGTQECYDILMLLAHSHANPIVRGASLLVLGSTYRSRVTAGTLDPNREVVHLFLQCVDDGQKVPLFQRRVGDIARQGFLGWTGIDLGESTKDSVHVLVGSTELEMSSGEYHEYWWSTELSGLLWNQEEGRFTSPK